jgi:hypothetical protein
MGNAAAAQGLRIARPMPPLQTIVPTALRSGMNRDPGPGGLLWRIGIAPLAAAAVAVVAARVGAEALTPWVAVPLMIVAGACGILVGGAAAAALPRITSRPAPRVVKPLLYAAATAAIVAVAGIPMTPARVLLGGSALVLIAAAAWWRR